MKYTVIGMFNSNSEAQLASDELIENGFSNNTVNVSTVRTEGEYDGDDFDFDEDKETGGFWNWLFGDDEAKRNNISRVGARSNIVTVYADSRTDADRAAQILDHQGALDVEERAAAIQNSGLEGVQNQSIPVVEEEIAVGKREIETGGVRVRSMIIEKPVEESIKLRKERVYIRRRPVNRPATSDAAFENQTVEFIERNEEAVVEKSARVVEEVVIGKDVEEVVDTVSDTVRETKIEIDENTNGSAIGHSGHRNPAGSAFSKNRIDKMFSNAQNANEYFEFLIDKGYSTDDITVIMSKETKDKFYGGNEHISDTADEALRGAGTGSAIGGTIGAVTGAIAAVGSSILVPGLGLAIAGPIAAALAGAGAGGASGALIGALTNAGISESIVTEYEESLNRGEIIISVQPKDKSLYTESGYGRNIYSGHQTA